jgi:hypothetical protein
MIRNINLDLDNYNYISGKCISNIYGNFVYSIEDNAIYVDNQPELIGQSSEYIKDYLISNNAIIYINIENKIEEINDNYDLNELFHITILSSDGNISIYTNTNGPIIEAQYKGNIDDVLDSLKNELKEYTEKAIIDAFERFIMYQSISMN